MNKLNFRIKIFPYKIYLGNKIEKFILKNKI